MSSQSPSDSSSSAETPASPIPAGVGGDPAADRRVKLQRVTRELGLNPFGGRVENIVALSDARAAFDADADTAAKAKDADPAADRRPIRRISGRVVLHRDIGKLVFMTLRDHSGDLQIGVSKNNVDETTFKLAKLIDLGDLVVATGRLGSTKTGEITLWAAGSQADHALTMACKSLAAPPEKWHGLQDADLRYRRRYVDLYANPPVMQTLKLRMRIVEEVRQFLKSQGFMEVETPMLQPIHGGAAARPFITHHNALDMRLYLRIAPELYLKRLLVGGFDKVFEINRNFRNEGISPRHNPEFTMLEAYSAFGNWQTMAEMVERMICTVAQNVLGTLTIQHKNAAGEITRTINLQGDVTKPQGQQWRRVSMADLVKERTGWAFNQQPLTAAQIDQLRLANPGKDLKLAGSPAEQLVETYEKLIEPTLIDPCFVTRVPSIAIPLARECPDDPFFADVYELAINGQEISPGYSELNDPDIQERHLRHQIGDREEQQVIDEDFINALRVGMPPAGGMGMGVDRLVMMLTGAESIRDVILFPLMRPVVNPVASPGASPGAAPGGIPGATN